jgi:hypothetical protein
VAAQTEKLLQSYRNGERPEGEETTMSLSRWAIPSLTAEIPWDGSDDLGILSARDAKLFAQHGERAYRPPVELGNETGAPDGEADGNTEPARIIQHRSRQHRHSRQGLNRVC